MCDPITLGGLALSIGSTVAGSVAQGQVDDARSGRMSAERGRQAQYNQQADAINDRSQGRYGNFQEQEDAKAKEVADFYKANTSALPTGGSTSGAMPEAGSNILVQEGKKQMDRVGRFGTQQSEALGKLRSFGDTLGGISREQSKDAGELGKLGSFRRGSAGVLPLELEEANSAGNDMKLFADILGGAGKVGTMAGLSGGTGGGIMNVSATGGMKPGASVEGSPIINSGGGIFSRMFGR